jgi:hypothetical protein
MKDYRFYGDEMEVLGQRLDAAHRALANSKSEWAKTQWQQTVDRLLFQWRQLPILHDGDAQVTLIPRYDIDFDFYEKGHVNEGNGIADRAYYKLFKHDDDLTASWENHRAARLAKAQF